MVPLSAKNNASYKTHFTRLDQVWQIGSIIFDLFSECHIIFFTGYKLYLVSLSPRLLVPSALPMFLAVSSVTFFPLGWTAMAINPPGLSTRHIS